MNLKKNMQRLQEGLEGGAGGGGRNVVISYNANNKKDLKKKNLFKI